MDAWFKTKRAGGFPVLGIEDMDGELLGFGTYGAFRPFPAFKYTAEHSVYVHKAHRGRGLGLALMKGLDVVLYQMVFETPTHPEEG